MGQVAITLMGRSYRFVCGDGEEARIKTLGDYVGIKVDQLSRDMGRTADDRILVMAALMLADELFEARDITASGAPATAPSRPRKPNAA
ncbi:MAG: cell division protein ZapA [Hyphomicrobiaceae bacterium]